MLPSFWAKVASAWLSFSEQVILVLMEVAIIGDWRLCPNKLPNFNILTKLSCVQVCVNLVAKMIFRHIREFAADVMAQWTFFSKFIANRLFEVPALFCSKWRILCRVSTLLGGLLLKVTAFPTVSFRKLSAVWCSFQFSVSSFMLRLVCVNFQSRISKKNSTFQL